MNNTKPEPVVYRPDFISSCNQVKILQGHLERLGFATDAFEDGIDAAVENGWLVVEDTETHYVSVGWEERVAALPGDCECQDLWEALGDAPARIDEMKEEILEAIDEVGSNSCHVRVNPYSVEVDRLPPDQGGESANLHTYRHWSAPEEWVRTFLPW